MTTDQILPQTPFDGQVYLDSYRVKWVYDAEIPAWTRIGVVSDVPLARSESDPLGPTNGLLSKSYKAMLDALPPKAGGFGIILKPGYYLTPEKGVDNILTGDVKLVSNSLKFECTQGTTNDGCGVLPLIRIGLSDDFLESYSIELAGPKGRKGDKGPKGRSGRSGTGDGPQGDPGPDGKDATPVKFSGIIYEELDAVYNTAVVNLKFDAPNGILEITKAQMDVPSSDKPATRVAASPIIRDISFNQTQAGSLWSQFFKDWNLVAPAGDSAPTVDLNIIKLPKGWTSNSPVPITSVKLSGLAQGIIDYYEAQAATIAKQWDSDLKAWIVVKDKEARDILHNLAVQLADCQFELPLEFGLGIKPCSSSSSTSSSSSAGGGCYDPSFATRDSGKYPITSNTALYKLWREDPVGSAATVECTVDLCIDGNVLYPGYRLTNSEADAPEVSFPVSIDCNDPVLLHHHFVLITNLSAENGLGAIVLRGKFSPCVYAYYGAPGYTSFFSIKPAPMMLGGTHVLYVCREY